MEEQKPKRKKYIVFAIVAFILLFWILTPSDKGKISAELYRLVAKNIVEQGGDPQFDVNYIEVKGNNADISYNLLGGSFKARASKNTKGEWIISK